MAIFIPKEVVEKLKEAEKINIAIKELEKMQKIAEKISLNYQSQMNMIKSMESNVLVLQKRLEIDKGLRNLQEELTALKNAQEVANSISTQYGALEKAKKYSEMLNKASQELASQMASENNKFKSVKSINENYELFENLKNINENLNLNEDINGLMEKSTSSKYLSNFLKKINNK
ncbi:hypothetical protein [Acinetobacter haemolyticus]|uniref:hypothetical protein n=1 Tax=Acinetobacter haemolyticus TaxID=29430 RepID=UPI002DBCD427|nr:hypothetical protein [Acinetobacter haemolyticus]MEB6677277.1 hypothetical protein [Acinetobacter haemolyticus]